MKKLLKQALSLILAVLMTPWSLAQTFPPNTPTQFSVAANGTVAGMFGNDIYCTPQGTWIGPPKDGPANLPIRCMYTPISATPAPGVTRGPDSTTAAVQADINAAACGDRILIAAGSNLGLINLPPKSCDDQHWIWLLTTGYSDPRFPGEGTRMTPCWAGVASMPNRFYPCPAPANLMFKITAVSSSNGISSNGGDHFRIIGGWITRVQVGGASIYNLVDLGSANKTAVMTNHIIFDRGWFDGVEFTGPATVQSADTSTTRAIYLAQSNYVAVLDSYFTNFYDTSAMSANGNTDAQCIAGGVGNRPNSGWGVFKMVNNHCEASGEGILLGGSGGPPLTPAGCTIMVNCNLDVPVDSEIRENYFYKPPQWNGNTTTVGGTGWPVVKNGFEMKIGARALFEGNVIEGTWYHAQGGACWVLAPKNQSGGSPSVGTAPTALTNDFTYRYNYCYNNSYGIGLFQSMDIGCTNCEAQGANGISIHDNLIMDDFNTGAMTSGSMGDTIEISVAKDSAGLGRNQINNMSIIHNTFVSTRRSLMIFGADSTGQMHNLVMQSNIWPFGTYGVGPVGNTSTSCESPFGWGSNNFYGMLNACVTNWTANYNVVFGWKGGAPGTAANKWPTDGLGSGNFFQANVSGVGFTNYGTGNSNFNPGNYKLLPTSPYYKAAPDGTDIGADTDALLAHINGVRL